MNETNSYADRLASAMEEAGFGGQGGQSRLAEEVGAKSQTINQALGGGSKVLSAIFHCRVAHRLGVRAYWLSEGQGARYEPPMQVPLIGNTDQGLGLMVAEETVAYGNDPFDANSLTLPERHLISTLRRRPPSVVAAVSHLVQATRPAQG